MKSIVTAIFSLFLSQAAFAGVPLQSIWSPITPVLKCASNNPQTTTSWVNTGGAPVYVTDGYVWIGETRNGVSDTSFWLTTNTGFDVVNTNWDHYSNPVGAEDNLVRFGIAPNYFVLNPGDTLTLSLNCQGPYTHTPASVQGQFVFHFSITAP